MALLSLLSDAVVNISGYFKDRTLPGFCTFLTLTILLNNFIHQFADYYIVWGVLYKFFICLSLRGGNTR